MQKLDFKALVTFWWDDWASKLNSRLKLCYQVLVKAYSRNLGQRSIRALSYEKGHLFWKKGNKNFTLPLLFNPVFCIKIKLCLIFEKEGSVQYWIQYRSRICPAGHISYFGFSWLLVSYGSSFAICKTCFLHISTKLCVHNKKPL